jgi:NADH-quinone oxidoreductase subunit L
MNDMGALRKYMPFTWIFMSIAALSLMGVPPLPGFWSKDAILLSSLKAHHYPLFFLALITVVVTSFYSVRFIGMVFYGKRSKNIENLTQKGVPLIEPSHIMVGACGVLSLFIVILGIFGISTEHLLKEGLGVSLEKFHLPVEHDTGSSVPHVFVPLLSVISVIIGIVPAYFLYLSGKIDPKDILENHAFAKVIHQFFWNRWHMDRFYYMIFVDGMTKLFNSVPEYIENPLNKFFHEIIPSIPERLHRSEELILTGKYGQEWEKGTTIKGQKTEAGINLGFALLIALSFIGLFLIGMFMWG